jgi:hypothetical protein
VRVVSVPEGRRVETSRESPSTTNTAGSEKRRFKRSDDLLAPHGVDG